RRVEPVVEHLHVGAVARVGAAHRVPAAGHDVPGDNDVVDVRRVGGDDAGTLRVVVGEGVVGERPARIASQLEDVRVGAGGVERVVDVRVAHDGAGAGVVHVDAVLAPGHVDCDGREGDPHDAVTVGSATGHCDVVEQQASP